jgi:hypothetical protein
MGNFSAGEKACGLRALKSTKAIDSDWKKSIANIHC